MAPPCHHVAVGVKPLFYSSRSGFAFASTLEAFFALQDFPRRIDYEALRDYLAFQVCLAPQSFLRDVRQLPPASWLLWRPREYSTIVVVDPQKSCILQLA